MTGVSGDLAYIAGIERTTASVGDGPPEPYALVTTAKQADYVARWRPHRNVLETSRRGAVSSRSMRGLLRIALLVIIAFLLLSVVVGIASAETGAVEKVALAG